MRTLILALAALAVVAVPFANAQSSCKTTCVRYGVIVKCTSNCDD